MDLYSFKYWWIHEYASLFMYPYVKRKTENLGKCNTKSMLSFERECGFKPTASRTARKLIFIILSHSVCGT